MESKCSYVWGNAWRQVVAGGIMVQIIPVKVHHALIFSTKRKWGAKNKFNFTAPLSSERKEPCDYRRLLVSWQSGPFWSPGCLCCSDVCSANGLIFGSRARKKDTNTSALLWFLVVSEAAGLQPHHLRAMKCEPTGNFNPGIISACSLWLLIMFAQVSIHSSTATS